MLTPAKAGHPDTGESCIYDSAGSCAWAFTEFMLHAGGGVVERSFEIVLSAGDNTFQKKKKKHNLRNAAESGNFKDRLLLLLLLLLL